MAVCGKVIMRSLASPRRLLVPEVSRSAEGQQNQTDGILSLAGSFLGFLTAACACAGWPRPPVLVLLLTRRLQRRRVVSPPLPGSICSPAPPSAGDHPRSSARALLLPSSSLMARRLPRGSTAAAVCRRRLRRHALSRRIAPHDAVHVPVGPTAAPAEHVQRRPQGHAEALHRHRKSGRRRRSSSPRLLLRASRQRHPLKRSAERLCERRRGPGCRGRGALRRRSLCYDRLRGHVGRLPVEKLWRGGCERPVALL